MVIDTIMQPATSKGFPCADVEGKLRDLMVKAVESDARLKCIVLPADTSGICATSIHIDSLGVVELLCGLEPLVGFDLKASLVKAGGYKSINHAVGHLMPRIEKAWTKHRVAGEKK
jgi:hypothetical protein